jgi:hypothetical protein
MFCTVCGSRLETWAAFSFYLPSIKKAGSISLFPALLIILFQ